MKLRDIFLDIEHSNDLLSLKIDGVLFWAYNRYAIFNAFYQKAVNERQAHETIPIKSQLLNYIKNLKFFFPCRKLTKEFLKSHHSTLVFSHPRRVLTNGKYVSIYTDPLIPENWDAYTFEMTDLYEHHTPTFTNKIIYVDDLEITCRFHYLIDKFILRWRYKALQTKFREDIIPHLKQIENISGIEININNVEKFCLSHFYVAKYAERYWERLFSRGNVTKVIEVVGYNIVAMALNNVAKKYGVKTIELQHGMLSEDHIGYQYHNDDFPSLTPDYIFTFSDFWGQEINISNAIVKSIGFEFFNKQKHSCVKSLNEKNILFISQMSIGHVLSKLAIDLAALFKQNDINNTIIYKLHPSEFASAEKLYPSLYTMNNIQVVRNEYALYDLFGKSKVQVGYNSTAIFEGLSFELITCIIPSEDNLMIKLLDEGYANAVSCADEIYKCILSNVKNKDTSSMWKDCAKKNFIEEVEKIYK